MKWLHKLNILNSKLILFLYFKLAPPWFLILINSSTIQPVDKVRFLSALFLELTYYNRNQVLPLAENPLPRKEVIRRSGVVGSGALVILEELVLWFSKGPDNIMLCWPCGSGDSLGHQARLKASRTTCVGAQRPMWSQESNPSWMHRRHAS